MTTGMVFDIKEFAVHDGPGIRTTVFLKGCPLRCNWCHNPESQTLRPQVMRSPIGERIAGREMDSQELALILNRQASVLKACGGGVTFSGGEPLVQAQFVADVIDRLDNLHVLLDTSGCAAEAAFSQVLQRCDLVFYDLKLIDPDLHHSYTGGDNLLILHNLKVMVASGVPYVIRVPLIPGVTDTDANLAAIARTVSGLPGLQRIDLLPYNRAAGAKYRAAGMEFRPSFDETRPVHANLELFASVPAEVRLL